MGVALGFTIAELNCIEYRRFNDRQQATYDMLVIWRGRQESILAAKNTLIALMESLQSLATEITISDIGPNEEIPDSMLLQVARRISKERFYEIGNQLGFDRTELQHIEHRSLYNRKDANIQMLSSWKASQTSMDKGEEKLQIVWKSVTESSKATCTNDAGDEKDETDCETPLVPEVNSNPSPQEGSELDEDKDHEEWKIIEYTESDRDETAEDIDVLGGSPSNGELCGAVRVVGNLTTALDLSRALRVDDNDIIGLIAPSNPALMERLAWQFINQWYRRLGKLEKEEKLARLFQGYNSKDTQTDISEISKKIHTNPDLLHLSQWLDLSASEVLQVMASSLTLDPAMIRQVVLQILQKWARQGGTRLRLLEIAKAFHLNDAAEQIATAISQHPGFPDPFTHATIDHNGGELKLHDLGIRVSIPSGAISKGMRSVVTLCVPRSNSYNTPLDDGEVLVTPIIRCSFLQELRKPAAVTLPHCIIISERYQQKKEDLCLKLYTKLGQGKFGYRAIESSKDFEISEDRITFSTRHLQYFALSSNDVRGIQFICEVSQPLFKCNTPQPTLRIRIAHPYNKDSVEFRQRNDSRSQEIFYQVTNVIKFTLDSAEDDIMVLCVSDSKKTQETVHVGSLLSGGCIIAHFNLPPSSGHKSVGVCIEQGSSTLAEQEIHIASEVEPNYEQPHRRGRIRFVSNHMLQMLSGLVCEIKDARELGYKLGFSNSMVSKYLSRADSSASSVSGSGLKEMLQDWRRRVRPSEQVNELRLALEAAGLRRESEVIFQEN
ncbi:uncharacterized protein LOC121417785 [Lytechinus variegatus]|uniref:uncharacterized protein LOC121417785 n=1 Tax=Lytechinus variegatus TaxID=7654 RepID=UPI001BB28F54|nr:uncharacterized protein LOC121417785 [Lytechinus variegatus]